GRATSSPITSTEPSRASSVCRQSFTASTSVSSAKPTLTQHRRRFGFPVRKHRLGTGRWLGLRRRDPLPHRLGRHGPDLLHRLLVGHAEPAGRTLRPAHRPPLPLLL